MKISTYIIFILFTISSSVTFADDYSPLLNAKGKIAGLCSVEILDDDGILVNARATNLPTHSAFTAWLILRNEDGENAGPSQLLDGTVTGSDKNYNFNGVGVDLASVYSVIVDIRDHGKPDSDPDILTSQVSTPGGGCDGACPTVALCELFLAE